MAHTDRLPRWLADDAEYAADLDARRGSPTADPECRTCAWLHRACGAH